jgi:hypothetical protein
MIVYLVFWVPSFLQAQKGFALFSLAVRPERQVETVREQGGRTPTRSYTTTNHSSIFADGTGRSLLQRTNPS